MSSGNEYRFYDNFALGVATSAYQIEGAADKDGKGASIWDVFSSTPGKIYNNHTANEGCDHYYRFKEDIAMMYRLNIRHYRFSISWPRILPEGSIENVNKKGVEFYNELIDELISYGIVPYVTLYHWDLPQALYEKYDGWISSEIIGHYADYAELCFRIFGDRVKKWITFNEPWCVSVLGYGTGELAPGHNNKPGTEPYLAAHNILLAHAEAVRRLRIICDDCEVGMALNVNWWQPISETGEDIDASKRALAFTLGWFADPIYLGDYPKIMKEIAGNRLPNFTREEKRLLKGSCDFLGINHYTTLFCGKSSPNRFLSNFKSVLMMTPTGMEGLSIVWSTMSNKYHYYTDMNVMVFAREGMACTDMKWIVMPKGIYKVLEYCHNSYNYREGIYIFENGCAVKESDNPSKPLNDQPRISYIRDYLKEVNKAVKNGINVRGYFVWSFLDNFEWTQGFSKRFGLVHVNHTTQKRTPKASADWYSKVCLTKTIHD